MNTLIYICNNCYDELKPTDINQCIDELDQPLILCDSCLNMYYKED